MKNIFLVDFMSFFFRCYWVYKNDSSVNLIELVDGMIQKQIKTFNIENIIICDDTLDDDINFRKKIYPEYKENRKEKDDELHLVLETTKEKIKEKYMYLSRKGFECDDILGTLAKYLYTKDYKTIIFTSDKDMLQLVNDKTFIVDTRVSKKGKEKNWKPYVIYTENEVFDKYGFPVEALIDYYALLGDSIDNIPWVHGIGEKGAANLIKEYKTLDNIYLNIDNIKGSTQKKLIEWKENAYLSKKLFQLAEVPDIVKEIDKEKVKVANIKPRS